MRTLALMICVFLLTPAIYAGGGGGKNKKERTDDGREDYYKYERVEVKHLRDVYEFTMPEPPKVEKAAQPLPANPTINLDAYFQHENRYFIESDTRLEQYRERHRVIIGMVEQKPGWRIQVFTGSVRTNAFNVKNSLMSLYPDFSSYMDYDLPNYKVRLGDFLDKEAAEMFCRQVREERFPGAFLVQEMIPMPQYEPLKEESDLMDLNNRN